LGLPLKEFLNNQCYFYRVIFLSEIIESTLKFL